MKITNETVEHIAHLARLEFEGDDKEAIRSDLERIVNFMEKLQEVNTENVEPLTSVAETTLKLRPDEVKSKNLREQIIKNSPKDNEDYFVVPKVIE